MTMTATATVTAAIEVTAPPRTWDDVPLRITNHDDPHPYMVAIVELDPHTGAKRCVTVTRDKRTTLALVNDYRRIHRGTYYRALLPVCPICDNYGGAPDGHYCDCPAGEALGLEDDALERIIDYSYKGGL